MATRTWKNRSNVLEMNGLIKAHELRLILLLELCRVSGLSVSESSTVHIRNGQLNIVWWVLLLTEVTCCH